MGIDELMEELIRLAPTLPNRGLSERRSAVFFGQPKWFTNTTLQVESTFATSVSKVLFPLDLDENGPKDTSEAAHTCGVLDSLFSYGGMASPMMRIVREERQLVYGISTDYDVIPGRSYFGFSTMSKRENVPAIIDSFNDVLKAPELDSKDRLEEMKECLSAEIEMMSADPTEFRSKAISQFRNYGRMIGYKEVIDRFNRITIEDIRRFRQLLDPDKAIIFIYRGMGKE